MVGLEAVIVAVTDEVPRILTVPAARHPFVDDAGDGLDALPYGPLDLEGDRTLELAVRRRVREQTGIELGYVEQLYTLGDRGRHADPATRLVSVTYLALVREGSTAGANWRDWYDLFPWEDWREGRPAVVESSIVPRLEAWVGEPNDEEHRRARRRRARAAFGLEGSPWDGERVLERYELLYEVGLVEEAHRGGAKPPKELVGRPMALDHRRIAATALGRLRGKLRYRPVVFELLPATFTLSQLQRVVEALAGVRLHTQNFRRLLERNRLVEGTGMREARTGGRPAELFRFREEVLLERTAPGIGLPEVRSD